MKALRILARASNFALCGKFWCAWYLVAELNSLRYSSLRWVNGE